MLKHILGLVLNKVKASKPTDILPKKNSENFFKKKEYEKITIYTPVEQNIVPLVLSSCFVKQLFTLSC